MLYTVKKIERVLAIGAHPDDIEIGCGGSLAKWAIHGTKIYMFVLTHGEIGGDLEVRHREQQQSALIMGVNKFFWGDYYDTQVIINKQIIYDIEKIIKETRPEIILTHHRDDTHQDHRNLSLAAITAARNAQNMLFFEGPTTFNFSPTVFVDIEETIDKKRNALIAHKSQIDKTNIQDRNIVEIAEANAIFRGMEGRAKYAEGFIPLRFFI